MLGDFSLSEPMHVTNIQMKRLNIPSIPEAPFLFSSSHHTQEDK